jgi:putative membrane protein (TIGR04086 family)
MGIVKSVELQGLLKALLFGIICCLATSVVIYFTSLAETLTGIIGNIILIASVLYASSYVSKARGNKGLIRGLTMGVLFYILLLIFSLIFQYSSMDIRSFILNFFACLGAGALGGIIGIGLNPN